MSEEGRCEITGNLLGTDTRPGHRGEIIACECLPCRKEAAEAMAELRARLAALERVRVVAEALESATTAYKVLFGTKWLHQKLREALAAVPPKREGGE